jgi:hypothetical protein
MSRTASPGHCLHGSTCVNAIHGAPATFFDHNDSRLVLQLNEFTLLYSYTHSRINCQKLALSTAADGEHMMFLRRHHLCHTPI